MILEVYYVCVCVLMCHCVWRSVPALEYILAGRESACGCINVCRARQLRADLANGRRFHAAEMQPPLISAPVCVRACVHGALIGAERDG